VDNFEHGGGDGVWWPIRLNRRRERESCGGERK
jgi:hypothetical protein